MCTNMEFRVKIKEGRSNVCTSMAHWQDWNYKLVVQTSDMKSIQSIKTIIIKLDRTFLSTSLLCNSFKASL
jgi:hypothetical protein